MHMALKKLLHFLAIPSAFRLRLTVVLGYCGIMAFISTLTITAADKDAMQTLELALENHLRTANLHEDVISALMMRKFWIARCSARSIQPKMALQLQPRTHSELIGASASHMKKRIGEVEESLESGQIRSRRQTESRRCSARQRKRQKKRQGQRQRQQGHASRSIRFQNF